MDTLGIKFEDLLNLYLESTTTEAFHTVLKERVTVKIGVTVVETGVTVETVETGMIGV